MKKVKRLIKNNFQHFIYFYTHLKYRVFIAFSLSILVGVLDGFGLTMFFPLLEMTGDEGENVENQGLGGLSFLIDGIKGLGINLNIYTVLFIIAIFFILKGGFKFLEQYYNVLTRQYFIRKLRYDNIDNFANYRYQAFVLNDSGRIQNTLSGEVERVSQAYRNYFMAIQSGILVLVYIAFAIITNVQFAILVVIGGVLSNYLYKQIYKKTKETSRKITRGGHAFQGLLIQQVSFFKYLKATNYIKVYSEKLKIAVDRIVKNETKIGFYNSLLNASREPVVILIVVLVILIQVKFFSESISLIVLSLLFFYRSLTSLVMMQNFWNQFLNVSGSLENMTSFMKELASEQENDGGITFTSLNHSIVLENVSFGYNETLILNRINLTIHKNETIAFVGESGSGKTTIVNIIVGLMNADSGSMFVDGKIFSSLDLTSFQSKIGYITQEPVIFNDSVYNNVTFWAPKSYDNLNRFWEAIRIASIERFVQELPDKENSVLGNNGILISGGQKQRLSIARELYRQDIELLVLDEATSSLDSETENIIQNNIVKLQGKFTILIVAHRLSTIKHADKIILLNKGKIEAIGTFESLIQNSTRFREMVYLQEV